MTLLNEKDFNSTDADLLEAANLIELDIQECEVAIENLDETVEELNKLSDKSLPEKSGVSSATVESMLLTLEAPSTEGFIKNWATAIWDAIKSAFKAIWNKLKDWYLKIFSAASRLKKRAIAIREKASNLTTTPENKTIDFGSAYKSIILKPGDKTVDLESVGALVGDHVGDAFNMLVNQANAMDSITSALKPDKDGKIEDVEKKASDIFKFDNQQLKEILKHVELVTDKNKTKASSDKQYHVLVSKDAYPGNLAVYFSHYDIPDKPPADMKMLADAIAKAAKFKLDFNQNLTDFKINSTDMDALNPSGIEDIANDVEHIADFIVDFQKDYERVDKAKNTVDKAITNFSKEMENAKNLDGDAKTLMRNIVTLAKRNLSALEQPRQKIIGWALGVSINSLNLCDKSFSNLS